MSSLGYHANVAEFASALNRTLGQLHTFCGDDCDDSQRDFDATGRLGEVEAKRIDDYLMVKTRMGIRCGYDETGYLYHWQAGHWVRLWQSARLPNADGGYAPELLDDILFNYARGSVGPVATLGHNPHCWSNWHPVYWRLWQDAPGGMALLVDETRIAYLGAGDPIGASLRPHRFVVLFHVGSVDLDIHNRLAVYHYVIRERQIEREARSLLRRATSWRSG